MSLAIGLHQDPIYGVYAVGGLWLLTLLVRAVYIAYATSHTSDNQYTPNAIARQGLVGEKIRGVYGAPGASLTSSGFNQNSIDAGQAGEQQLFNALVHDHIIDRYNTVSAWSCPIPAKNGAYADPNYSSDIDAIIVSGHTVYVVDAKRWAGGANVEYKRYGGQVWRYRNGTPEQVMQLSRNMDMAVDRVKRMMRGTGYKVRGFVCVMPTEKGAARIAPLTFAPGWIPVVSPKVLSVLIKSRPSLLPVGLRVRRRLKSLVTSVRHPSYA